MASKAARVLGILLALWTTTRVALADNTWPRAYARSMVSSHCSYDEKRSLPCQRLCDLPMSQRLARGKACRRGSRPAARKDPASYAHRNRSYGPETARDASPKPEAGQGRDPAARRSPR